MTQRRTTRRKFLTAAGALGTVGLTSLSGCTGGGDTVTIGMANSLTGDLDTFGQRNKRGKELALQDINDAGLRGGELEIVVEDTQSVPDQAVPAARNLVNQEGVPMIVGAVNSSSSLSIFQSVVQGSNVAQLSQNSTSPDLTDFSNLMRISPPGREQAGAIASILEEDGHDSAAVAYVNNAYGEGIAQAIQSQYSGEIPYFQPHETEQSSYSSVVTEMDDSGADAWVFITYQPEFATIADNAVSAGITDVPVYGGDSTKGPDVLDQAPEEFIEGMTILVPSVDAEADNYQNFVSTFQDEYDKEPTSWAAYAYDAVVTAAIAIQADDQFTEDGYGGRVETVKEVTRSEGQAVTTYQEASDVLSDGGGPSDIDFQGVSGPIDLDENGDPAGVLQVFTVQNGEYVSEGYVTG